METAQLLSSTICGRCKSSLVNHELIDGHKVYKCKCGIKIRKLLGCNYCSKPFLIMPCLTRKTNYCSLNCYWTETNRKQPKTCKSCGKTFQAEGHLLKKGFGLYCSRDCWFKLFTKARKSLKCKQCNKIFTVAKSTSETKPKFCSKICKDDFERDYVSSVCRNCKQNFQLPRSNLNRGRGSFCGWKCFKTFRGETSIEKIVRLYLEELKINFVQEAKFGRFHADFLLPEKKTVIECDGEYWHGFKHSKKRDERKNKFLETQGYNLIRLTEKEIKDKSFKQAFAHFKW